MLIKTPAFVEFLFPEIIACAKEATANGIINVIMCEVSNSFLNCYVALIVEETSICSVIISYQPFNVI